MYSYNCGELLHSHITKSGYSVYELAKRSGVNRSTLQKILSNERKLNLEYLDKLKPFLKLSPREYKYLAQKTEEIQNGALEYPNNLFIKEMLENISEASFAHLAIENKSSSTEIDAQHDGTKLYYGKRLIENLIHELIQQEYSYFRPKMNIYVNSTSNIISNILLKESMLSSECHKLNIKQIVGFAKDKSDPNSTATNLRVLSSVLPNIVISKFQYDVFYYYEKDVNEISGNLGFPYYIVFTNAVVMLSLNCNTAILCTDTEILKFFSNLFEDFLQNTNPLINSCKHAEEILPHLLKLEQAKNPLYSLEYQPCFTSYMTAEYVKKYALPDIPFYEQATTDIILRAQQLNSLSKHTCYFNKQGLISFVQHGFIADFPPEYSKTIDIADRIDFLNQLYDEIATNRQKHRMINPYSFSIPHNLICVLHQNIGVDFYGFGTDDKNYGYIHISEPSISEAFEKFFQYIENSLLIYSKEETLDYIKQCIAQLSTPKNESS